jgi:hypothetical protein
MANFDGSPTGLVRVQKNFDICRRSSRPICNDCRLTLTGNITQTAARGGIAKARLPFETAGRMEVQTLMNEGIVRHLCKTHYPDEYGIAGLVRGQRL